MSLRVALMRPIAAAERSATLLRARGFEPAFAPVMQIVATGAEPPDENFDAVIATSANAFAFLSAEARDRLAKLRLYVAGERTAAAALAAGFAGTDEIAADARSLAALLAARPRPSRFLYLAARDRKSDIESVLCAAGHGVVAIEVYAAEARPAWSASETQTFASCAAALHYSRRSAELTIALAERAGLGEGLRATLHGCISKDAAEPLRSIGAKRIVVAAGAQESLLIDALSLATRIS
ncbi:uroporphyrinogen-III synthase [Methylocapsa sp. S129]|uniref:uroporphyrinogen-III synthase n=1 Tax=Methylocapsa sp. S129 TaxID=1641869 RepID=UPI00131D9E15|nr:uroporphyrinogen-III synthase [Methylocapsa sp. S129]